MRNNAQDANLPGRIDDRGNRSLSAASATAAPTTASDSELSGRIDGPGGRDLSGSAAASATAAGTPVRRTRLNLHGRRFGAGRTLRRQRNG
jgi:hypothetical protein